MKIKKNKLFIAALIVTAIGVISLFCSITDKSLLGGSAVVFIVGLALLAASQFLIKEKSVPAKAETPTIKNEENPNKSVKHSFPCVAANEGIFRAFTYIKVCFIGDMFNDFMSNIDKPLTLRQEPENEYDNKAIALYLGDVKCGYMYKGNLKDIVNSYFANGYTMKAAVATYNEAEKKATFDLCVYRPLDEFKTKTVPVKNVEELALIASDEYVRIVQNEYGDDAADVYDADKILVVGTIDAKYEEAEKSYFAKIAEIEIEDEFDGTRDKLSVTLYYI